MASPRRAADAALVSLLLCLAASCHQGGATVVADADPPPLPALSLQVQEPAADEHLEPTASVQILFTAEDPLATAMIRLVADGDGELATRDDQYELATMPAQKGSMHETLVIPLPTGIPLGGYTILGTIGDDARPSVTARAPGRILVESKGPGDPPVDPRLALQVSEPAAGRTVSRGGVLAVAFAAAGSVGTMDVHFVLDTDGDRTTTADQFALATLTTPIGAPQTAMLALAGAPLGLHHLLASATADGGALAQAAAPGLVRVVDASFAVREGNSTYEEGRATTTLPDASTVVVGRFSGSTSFGVWPQVHTLSSLGDDDIFLCRYLADGSLAWARRAGGPSRGDWANAVAAGTDGTFVVGGFFHGLAALDGGPVNSGLQSAGDDDAFLARYATDGTMLWSRCAGGLLHDEVQGVALLPDGSILATGSFAAQAIFGEAPGATTLLVQGSLASADGFVARYDAAGTLIWVRQFGGATGDDGGRGVAATPDGGCVVTGVFRGAASFGSGAGAVTLLAAGGADVFVARYDAGGQLLWARRGGGAADDEARGITVCADGACVAVGGFRGAATFTDPLQPVALQAIGGLDAFAARYAVDGALLTVRTAGGTADDEARSVAATADGGCLVTGHFQTAASLTGSLPAPNLLGFGSRDVFVARYAANGGLLWARAAGGTDYEQVLGLHRAADGSFAITGVFQGAAAFGEGARRQVLAASGWGDMFVVRYNADGDL
ncbi:MAG: hypothetical protein JNM25_05550 [Planctomycetes bacterium]|nr:hypothetical protein [Planctomycetota bacterium]